MIVDIIGYFVAFILACLFMWGTCSQAAEENKSNQMLDSFQKYGTIKKPTKRYKVIVEIEEI